MSSNQAINAISQNKTRYALQDHMLDGFAKYPRSTIKEVARWTGLNHEKYCDAPKRAWDLRQLGKIEETGERACSITGKQAQTYRVAEGAKYCGGKRLVMPQGEANQPSRSAASSQPKQQETLLEDAPKPPVVDTATMISGLRDLLDD